MVLEVVLVVQERALVQVCFEAVYKEACNTAAAAAAAAVAVAELVAVGLFGVAKQVQAAGCVDLRCSRSS